ncbi:MAG: ATP synthase F1 subunit gamma [Eubacteriaceae bacterium]|nr:ATP synthase F1 subunit gamma [Eubacteriaceae bacterium]
MAEMMQDIKRRIKSVGSTERITNAMKLVSASKLRKAKNSFEHSKTYMGKIFESMADALSQVECVPREYLLGGRETKNVCYVLITSSNGLCGSFNTTVIKALEDKLEEVSQPVKLVTIGTKGKDYFQRRGLDIVMTHDDPADSISFDEARRIADPLMSMYERGEIDEISIVYTSYINTLRQEPVVQRILPFDEEELYDDNLRSGIYHEMEYEPSAEAVFRYMIPKYLEMKIYNAALESATCEHAARRTAMENANDNARDMLSALQVHYNRARQAEITDEIIEIVAGSEAQR